MDNDGNKTRREFLLTGAASLAAGTLPVGAEASEPDSHAITPSNIEGPYYRPDAPFRTNLRSDDPKGDPFFLSGVVRSSPHSKPVAGAIVDIWHCNHLGHYVAMTPTRVVLEAQKAGAGFTR